jgi:hypothetical protein
MTLLTNLIPLHLNLLYVNLIKETRHDGSPRARKLLSIAKEERRDS